MKKPIISIPRTFRMVLPLRIVFLAIGIGFFVISIYSYFYEGASLSFIGTTAIIALFAVWWTSSVRLDVSEEGVGFQSGLTRKSLAWSDISGLAFYDQHWGTGGEMAMFVQSNNPSRKSIKINRLYFAGSGLRDFILTLMKRVPSLTLDLHIIRELEKYGVIEKTNAPA